MAFAQQADTCPTPDGGDDDGDSGSDPNPTVPVSTLPSTGTGASGGLLKLVVTLSLAGGALLAVAGLTMIARGARREM